MKSEKIGKVAIQLENNIHNQERDKTQKKTEKNTRNKSLKGMFEAKHLGHFNKSY